MIQASLGLTFFLEQSKFAICFTSTQLKLWAVFCFHIEIVVGLGIVGLGAVDWVQSHSPRGALPRRCAGRLRGGMGHWRPGVGRGATVVRRVGIFELGTSWLKD